jgi:DNA polymerase-1
MGDTGDNVPGVPGIGPKRAEQLVQEWGSTYDIIANLPIQSKYKYVAALNESKEQLLLNYQLMDLVTHCQEALGTENCEKVNNILETYVNE